MHTARIIVNSLALITGLCGLLWAVVSPALFVSMAAGFAKSPVLRDDWATWAGLASGMGIMLILGGAMLRQVWKHLRQPNQSTARAVTGFGCLVILFYLFRLTIRRSLLAQVPPDWDSRIEGLATVGVLLAAYLIYRFASRRLADAAFPPTAPESGVH